MNEPYTFPASERGNLSDAIAERLALYLHDGLAEAPRFVTRAGTGAPGDETQTDPAKVIFSDDEDPGVPHVVVAYVVAEGALEGYGDDQESSRWRVAVDCKANESQGTVTFGVDSRGADSILSDAVYLLLSDFEAMHAAGFVDAGAKPGAPEAASIELTNPIQATFEVYNWKE